jgi:hypothetical protein
MLDGPVIGYVQFGDEAVRFGDAIKTYAPSAARGEMRAYSLAAEQASAAGVRFTYNCDCKHLEEQITLEAKQEQGKTDEARTESAHSSNDTL